MKKIFVFLSALFTSLFLASVFVRPVQAIDGFVTVNSPKGGEVFTEGQTVNITWDTSSNIDKVAIMYKSDAHHGNWVVFSTPNTKSYSWNIDVGNTTNTQFYIEIIGYETGQGSITNFGGYFTVNQSASAPTAQPTSQITTQPTRVPTSTNSNSPTLTPYPTLRLSLTPTPAPILRTLSSVRWSSMFLFEGSMTTNLSKLKDPKNVEGFTIDTKYGWMMTYEETLDLTSTDRLKALQNIDKYWTVESWFIWIQTEWWDVYKEPAILSIKNDNLTGFAPMLDISESGNKPGDEVAKVESVENGVVKMRVSAPGKIVIKPSIRFTEKTYKTTKDDAKVSIFTSHKDLSYQIKINGQDRLVDTLKIDPDTGTADIKVDHLDLGDNLVQIYYREGEGEYVLADETTVNFVPWVIYVLTPLVILGLVMTLYKKDYSAIKRKIDKSKRKSARKSK